MFVFLGLSIGTIVAVIIVICDLLGGNNNE